MRKLKYFSVLMLVGLLTLTGCSLGGKKLTVEERLEKALVNLASADSFTAKLSLEGEADGEDMDISALLKVAKDKNNYNLYFNVEASADMLDDDISIESYLLTSKKSLDLYLKLGYNWDHLSLDNSDLEDGFNLDVSDLEDIDPKEIKDAVKQFKKVKEGKTKDGITEIIVTIDSDDIEDMGYEIDDDVEVSFFVDKKNNLTKIKLDLSDYSDEIEDGAVVVEFKKINDTKVRVPKDIEEDADDIEIEDLLEEIMDLMGLNNDYDDDDDDDDYDDDDDFDSYTTDEIFHDVLLSASIKSCSSGEFKVDFKNYNDELFLYDDDYDVKRIEDGELTFTPDAEDSYSCNVTVTRQFVIDGKKCEVTNMDYHEGECK